MRVEGLSRRESGIFVESVIKEKLLLNINIYGIRGYSIQVRLEHARCIVVGELL